MPLTAISNSCLLGLNDDHIAYLTNTIGVHKDIQTAWQSMVQAAKHDGIELAIASGYRGFDRQLSIWNRKCTGQLPVLDIEEQVVDLSSLTAIDKVKAIMLFSALPGTSRHHWGTDIDVYAANLLAPDYQLQLHVSEYESGGPLAKLSRWLDENAEQFGFYRPYDTYRQGVYKEPWHLSYFPLTKKFEQALTPAMVKQCLATQVIEEKDTIIAHLDELFSQFVTNIGTPENE